MRSHARCSSSPTIFARKSDCASSTRRWARTRSSSSSCVGDSHRQPMGDAAPLHYELAELLEQHFLAIGESVRHYEKVVALDPAQKHAAERLIKLYLQAGAWSQAAARLAEELARIEETGE